MIGQFFGMTRMRPVDEGLFVPQATNILTQEHTYFSVQVSDGYVIRWHGVDVFYYRRHSNLCRFDAPFCSSPPSHYFEYSCRGMLPTPGNPRRHFHDGLSAERKLSNTCT